MKRKIFITKSFSFFDQAVWKTLFGAALLMCFAASAAWAQGETVIWEQSFAYGAGGVKDFGPSNKWEPSNVNSELADDFDIIGTITRVYVHGYTTGFSSPTSASSHYSGLNVRFYAYGADNKPGALQAEYFIPKNSPNFIYQNTGLGDLRVRLETPFQATGKHFVSAQLVINPSINAWYWRSSNADAIRGEAPYFRANPSAAWGRDNYNDGSRNLGLQLWGTRTLAAPPTLSGISKNSLPQAGRLKIAGTNFGSTQGTGVVRIGGAIAPVGVWTETDITAYVSDAATLGAGVVQVETQGGASNPLPFTVTVRPPANGRVKWRFQVDAGSIYGRPAVAADGTIYAVDASGHLYAVTPEGGIKWIFRRKTYAQQGASVGADGTVYFAAGNELYAVNADGTLKWTITNANGGAVAAGPNVGTDGNIYAVFDNTTASGLSAAVVSPAGQILDNDPGYFEPLGSALGVREIVFGAPGQYYFVLNNILDTTRSGMNFFALGGNHLFSRGQFYGQPVVAPDGTLYALNAQVSKVSQINPANGSVIRSLPNGNAAPEVGSDGNVYATENQKIFSFDAAGAPRWQFQSFGILGRPVVGSLNDVVALHAYDYAQPGVVHGINAANGVLSWQVNLPAENGGYVRGIGRPRFSSDGAVIYYGTNVNDYAADVYSYLYAISTSPVLPCSFGITPNSATYQYSSGSGSITVAATNENCQWTAASSVNWITVYNQNGAGNGTINYTVTANPTFAARTGTITIGGQTFTVTQGARTTATQVSITYPANGETFILPTNIFVGANATNQNGAVSRVEFYANDQLIGTDSSEPYQIVWNDPAATTYNLVAKSFDGSGAATVSETITITVAPVPPPEPAPLPIPPPTLTSPTANRVFSAGESIVYTAVPGTTQYPTDRVEFYLDTTLVGSDDASPYTYTLNNVPGGIYTVSARTVATTGAQATSPPIDIRVNSERSNAGAKAFDFDGDGKADVSVFRPANGAWYLNQSSAGFLGIQFGIASDKLVPADYDGDGKTDVAVYRSGVWYLQRSSLGFTGVSFGASDDVPVPADYDGDGNADLTVFRPSNGGWYILNLINNQFTATLFGAASDKPVPADYDGDGKTDIAVYRDGNWYIQRSQAGFIGIQFGEATDKPTVADYDGDGKADIAVFRPSNGAWYLQRSQVGFTGISFGFGTDLPVPGDYDGDGKTDLAVFRNGNWYIQRTQAGFTGVAFGASDDRPVPNVFVR